MSLTLPFRSLRVGLFGLPLLAVAVLVAVLGVGRGVGTGSSSPAVAKGAAARGYGQLPLSFAPNRGQAPAGIDFIARGNGYSVALSSTDSVLALRSAHHRVAVLGMRLLGANSHARALAQDALPGKVNYLIGRDQAKWRTGIPTYGQVAYGGVYPGVDAAYHGNQGQLEYDFVVHPGAKASAITLGFTGVRSLRIDHAGELVLSTRGGVLRERAPVAYQQRETRRVPVPSSFIIRDGHQVAFKLGAYDHSTPLVIDPTLVYSTLLEGSGILDRPQGIAVDGADSAYVVGDTFSTDYPTTSGAVQPQHHGGNDDAFVTKLAPDGKSLVYSTFLGGSSADAGSSVALDPARDAFVGGLTNSSDFPMAPGGFQPTLKGALDSFIVELNPAGSALVHSTFLGGSANDFGPFVALDRAGNVHVAGATDSSDFPTANAAQPSNAGSTDAYVGELSPDLSSLVYSTYLGGINRDNALGIAVDPSGNAYVAGGTESPDFPVKVGGFQTAWNNGSKTAFVTKFDPSGSVVYSTFLGGNNREGDYGGIAVDASGSAYVTGETLSLNFPTTSGAFQPTMAGSQSRYPGDAYVSKLDPTGGHLVYSTFLGGGPVGPQNHPNPGSGADGAYAIAVDSAGEAYVTGFTMSADFPTTNKAFQPHSCCAQTLGDNGVAPGFHEDAFLTKFNAAGSGLVYSTYLSGDRNDLGVGVAVDAANNAFVTGLTTVAPASKKFFPTTPGAFQTTPNANTHGWALEIAGL